MIMELGQRVTVIRPEMPQSEIDRINEERKKTAQRKGIEFVPYRVPPKTLNDVGTVVGIIQRESGTLYEVAVEREGAPPAVRQLNAEQLSA